ncbi:MAG: hypothetical protein ACYC35_04995 [Pirellulales bacterium]
MPAFDDMGKLLTTLGKGYEYQAFPLEDLGTAERIAKLDIIFLACSGVPESWLGQRVGIGARPGTETFTANQKVLDQVKTSLRDFVGRGGTLYASDWHFNVVSMAFPEFVDAGKAGEGQVQVVSADVVDPKLRKLVGEKIQLKFDKPGWRPAAFGGKNVTTYLEGSYTASDGAKRTAPLLIQFRFEKGAVIFTSFHNEVQNSKIESDLLRYLVFTTITAGLDEKVAGEEITDLGPGTLVLGEGGLFTAAGSRSLTRTWRCAGPGPVRFHLLFRNQGARLKLTVTGPDGKSYEQQGMDSLSIAVPQAAAGDWTATVTAVELSGQIPCKLAVGVEKK